MDFSVLAESRQNNRSISPIPKPRDESPTKPTNTNRLSYHCAFYRENSPLVDVLRPAVKGKEILNSHSHALYSIEMKKCNKVF